MSDSQDKEFEDLDTEAIKGILPHRYPMLLIDRLVDITRERAIGIKNVTANEPFFEGHFPARAVMPGVLIIESMAQAAAVFTAYADGVDTTGKVVFFMGIERAKFRKPVVPGDQIRHEITINTRRPPIWKYDVKSTIDGKVAAEATFSAMLTDPHR